MYDTTGGATPQTCLDCGSERVRVVYVRSPRDANYVAPTGAALAPDDSGYEILRCADCGSIFLHPRHFEESFAVYETERYFTGYFPDNIHKGGGPSLASNPRSARRQNQKQARFLLRLAGLESGPEVRVLDIGCGGGDLLLGFVELGCDATGVDVSGQAVAEAQSRGLRALHGRFDELDFPVASMDLIVSIEAFEHMADLRPVVVQVQRALKLGGAFILQVPNDIDGYRRRAYRRIWWMIPPMHIRYFTEESVGTVFGRLGFRVEQVRTTGSVGRDLAAVLNWRLRKSGLRLGPLARLLILACRPADAILNALRMHSEMIVLLRPDSESRSQIWSA